MDHGFHSSGFGGFLFGEIVSLGDRADFGNLMLSRILVEK